MNYFILSVSAIILMSSCAPKEPTAQEIVDKAIAAAGGAVVSNATISFKFRDYYYSATRTPDKRSYERCVDPNCLELKDLLINNRFTRFREGEKMNLSDSLQRLYAGSVNSVHYFSVLPFGLNDPAVIKQFHEKTSINDQPYYAIKVTFTQEGGGEDFEDEYMYWIHRDSYKVDYLAYNYRVNEGGTRFRQAFNERFINGVRFVDYRNYKPQKQFPPLADLDSLFENDALELLSVIELDAISVLKCPDC